MKKGLGIFMVSLLAAAVLSGCTQSDVGNSNAGAGSTATSGSGTVEAAGGAASGSGTIEASGTDTAAQSGSTSGEVSGEAASDHGSAEGDTPVFDGGVSVEEDLAEETEGAGEANLSEEQLAALEEGEDPSAEESWIGSYINEAEEILTISAEEDSSVTFAFSNAGISGVAERKENQATYNGDDHHVVVFEFSGTDIKVTVLSEEDYDASGSPINGVFVRQ